jgi:hypothetical protein
LPMHANGGFAELLPRCRLKFSGIDSLCFHERILPYRFGL